MARPQRAQPDPGAILPDGVPVEMPELPTYLTITSPEQFKAIGDLTRSRILGIIQNQPATAKQIADRLGAVPGTIGHHLHVLEANGLAQVVARRLVRGIVAKYYTRTARIFNYDLPAEALGESSPSLEIISHARDELAESLAATGNDSAIRVGFPHARLSAARAEEFNRRLDALVEGFLGEPTDADGQLYGLCVALFVAPPYLQMAPARDPAPGSPTPAPSK